MNCQLAAERADEEAKFIRRVDVLAKDWPMRCPEKPAPDFIFHQSLRSASQKENLDQLLRKLSPLLSAFGRGFVFQCSLAGEMLGDAEEPSRGHPADSLDGRRGDTRGEC